MEKKELFYFLMSVPVVFVSVLTYGMVLMKNIPKDRIKYRSQLNVFIFCINMLYLLLFNVFSIYCLYCVFHSLGLYTGFWFVGLFLIGLAITFSSWVIKNILFRQDRENKSSEDSFSEDGIEEKIEKKLIDLFENQCIYRKPGLTITEVARLAGTNRTYVSVVIHKKFNTHFGGFVNRYRIHEATELMRSTRQTIREIAETVGFNSISAFNSSFREVYGQSPTHWKNQQ